MYSTCTFAPCENEGIADWILSEFDDVKLEFEEDAITAIADRAFERKTGARGLRSIMENSMMDLMYEIPSNEDIQKCVITKGTVEGTDKPIIIYNE